MLVTSLGAMVGVLEGEKLVNCLHGTRVGSNNADLPSPRQLTKAVLYQVPLGRHDRRSGNRPIVNHGRRSKIPGPEGRHNLLEMPTDLGHAGRVRDFTLELDPASIGQGLETMG